MFWNNFRIHKICTCNHCISGKGDPHFEVTMKGIEYPICFDIKASPGAILRILHISKGIVHVQVFL